MFGSVSAVLTTRILPKLNHEFLRSDIWRTMQVSMCNLLLGQAWHVVTQSTCLCKINNTVQLHHQKSSLGSQASAPYAALLPIIQPPYTPPHLHLHPPISSPPSIYPVLYLSPHTHPTKDNAQTKTPPPSPYPPPSHSTPPTPLAC